MQHERASFWADIKNYEEHLAQNPDSYLFSRLSDAYLKLNLVDDALHTARRGVEKFPAYVAGQRSLALACYAKGLMDESRQALEAVVAAVPEDAESQRILGRLLVAAGDLEGAQRLYRVLLDFHPDDEECREELRLLEQPSLAEVAVGVQQSVEQTSVPDLPSLAFSEQEEDVIDLDDGDILLEEVVEEEPPVPAAAPRLDPLSTATLAELYVQQGFLSKALDIYRSLAVDDPGNSDALSRIAEIEAQQMERAAAGAVPPPLPEAVSLLTVQEAPMLPSGIPVQGQSDAVVTTLEGWLDSIRRIKACR